MNQFRSPDSPRSRANVSNRGPGVTESVFWVLGVAVAQFVAMSVSLLLVLLAVGWQQGLAFLEASAKDPLPLISQHIVPVFIGTQVLFLGMVLFASRLRLQPHPVKMLSFRPILWKHFVLMLLILCPLMIVNNYFHTLLVNGWQNILDQYPQLSFFDTKDSMQFVSQLAEKASIPTLILTIALVPAVAEELIFRGVIGRGMLYRYGLVGGIAITSILFALVHINPPHVIALLPLAIIMHIAYVATRSFWAPVLMHFLNNAMAVFMLSVASAIKQQPVMEIPLVVFLPAALCVVGSVVSLWISRIQFVTEDDVVWSPGYVTVEQPPAELNATPISDSIPYRYRWLILISFVTLVYTMSAMGPN